MKLAIIGSRDFKDRVAAEVAFKRFFCTFVADGEKEGWWPNNVEEIISGGARGADKIGAEIAHDWGIKLTEFIPDWEKHGKRAGFLRNEDIVKSADMVLCFWDGVSKGTQNSLSIAKRLKKPTLIIYF